jgi:hypothetical protein
MGSNPFLIKPETRVFSIFLRFSPFFSLFQSAPPEKVRCSQTNHEPSDTRFWAFFGRFRALSAGFQPDFSVVSVCSAAGWGQISGQNRQIKT